MKPVVLAVIFMTVQRKSNQVRLGRGKKIHEVLVLKDFTFIKYVLLVRHLHMQILISQNKPMK